jgi:hypothetical protein
VRDAAKVFSKLVWRRDADPGENQERGGDAEVRRIEKVAVAFSDGRAKYRLGTNGNRGGENDWKNPIVWIKQHAHGETGDVTRQ